MRDNFNRWRKKNVLLLDERWLATQWQSNDMICWKYWKTFMTHAQSLIPVNFRWIDSAPALMIQHWPMC
jgi:hypothetical protein